MCPRHNRKLRTIYQTGDGLFALLAIVVIFMDVTENFILYSKFLPLH